MLNYLAGVYFHPRNTWEQIHKRTMGVAEVYLPCLALLAAVPALAIYFGASHIGWTIGNSDPIRLTTTSAFFAAAATYCALLIGTFVLGHAIRWMSHTYGVKNLRLGTSVCFAAIVLSPMMFAGVVALIPSLWLYMIVFLVALAYTVYLLYGGLPVVLGISAERGFVYSSAILTVGLVMFVALLAITVLVWSFGLGPVFIR